jgi:hypothetical protein
MLARVYRATRAAVMVLSSGLVFLMAIIPWQQQRALSPAIPELESDRSQVDSRLLSPAGTVSPTPMSLPVKQLGRCPEGMVYVRGDYCPGLAHNCKTYIDEKMDRCGEFRKTSRCIGPSYTKTFCIDAYEFPNQAGEKPVLAVDWDRAVELCSKVGKRLCTAIEWTLACEGQGRLPYPYGYERDKEACNIDKPYIVPNDAAYASPSKRDLEVARLDQREPSGSRSACVSPFGVFDMTGNVDEWVLLESGSHGRSPYKSALKGGYWGPVRNRCRPITATHNRWHSGYQIGLRCCREPDPLPPGATDEPEARPSAGP